MWIFPRFFENLKNGKMAHYIKGLKLFFALEALVEVHLLQ